MKKIISILLFSGIFLAFSSVKAANSHDPLVKVFNAKSHVQDAFFKAYHPDFRGGVYVAAGDINGDKQDEIITGAGVGGGPNIRVFNSAGHPTGINFEAFHSLFRGGAKVSSGDTDGDLKDEIIVSQASKGEPWVKVYDCDLECKVKSEFLAFEKNFRGGVSVAAGDFNGDGKDELIVGAGEGGGPQIRILDEFGKFLGFSPHVFSRSFRGGVNVAAGDTTGDGIDEIIVSQGNQGQAWVKVYDAKSGFVHANFLAYDRGHEGGAYLAAGDIDGDGKDEIVTGVGDVGGPHVRIFKGDGSVFDPGFFAYGQDFRGGVTVAVGKMDGTVKIVTGPGKSLVEGRTDLYKYIEIDLGNAKLYAYKNGRKVVESLISAGRPGMRTPSGWFQVRRKSPNVWSSYGLWMPYSLNFTGSYFIHKLPVWPSGYVEGENHLGIHVSHGCVRVSNEAAPILYEFADLGTPVYIHW